MTTGDLVKIIFDLDPSPLHSHSTESMWAKLIEARLLQIENIPFYVYGVNYKDVVNAVLLDNCVYKFVSVSSKSGHSTYRIFLLEDKARDEYEALHKKLEEMGCNVERGSAYISTVDVPPETDIYLVYNLLEDYAEGKDIEFEEGDCGHPLTRDAS